MSRKQLMTVMIAACAMVILLTRDGEVRTKTHLQKGLASWYGHPFVGERTASGERFSQNELTAAHRKLPLGTKVMVKSLETHKQVEVKINDRGPYVDSRRRIIDLSRAAADRLGLLDDGVGRVEVAVTERPPVRHKPHDKMFYVVQVRAFEDPERASTMADQLRPRYPSVYIAPHDGPFGPYYRVRIGPFSTPTESRRVAHALQRAGHYTFVDEVPRRMLWRQPLN